MRAAGAIVVRFLAGSLCLIFSFHTDNDTSALQQLPTPDHLNRPSYVKEKP